MIQTLEELVLRLNETFTAGPDLVNFLTGLIFVVTILSMRKFSYTPSSAFKWSKTLYNTGCVLALVGLSLNRLVNYPTTYPLSSILYLAAYLFFCGYILYAGSVQHKRSLTHGE